MFYHSNFVYTLKFWRLRQYPYGYKFDVSLAVLLLEITLWQLHPRDNESPCHQKGGHQPRSTFERGQPGQLVVVVAKWFHVNHITLSIFSSNYSELQWHFSTVNKSFCMFLSWLKVDQSLQTKIGHHAALFPTIHKCSDFLFRVTLSRNHLWILQKECAGVTYCQIYVIPCTSGTSYSQGQNVSFRYNPVFGSTERSEQIWEPVLHQTSMAKISGCISGHLNKLRATTDNLENGWRRRHVRET